MAEIVIFGVLQKINKEFVKTSILCVTSPPFHFPSKNIVLLYWLKWTFYFEGVMSLVMQQTKTHTKLFTCVRTSICCYLLVFYAFVLWITTPRGVITYLEEAPEQHNIMRTPWSPIYIQIFSCAGVCLLYTTLGARTRRFFLFYQLINDEIRAINNVCAEPSLCHIIWCS